VSAAACAPPSGATMTAAAFNEDLVPEVPADVAALFRAAL
jgi:hypothetical protein